jgi:4a-hydroxytetrahydrobiopterin dehydratase
MRTALTTEQRSALAATHPEWLVEEKSMSRTFAFGDFGEAMAFVTRTALAAEVLDHHPDIDIRWNRVTLVLSTHSAGGLTELDRDLATKVDGFL